MGRVCPCQIRGNPAGAGSDRELWTPGGILRVPEAVDSPTCPPSLGSPWVVAARGKVGLGEGFKQIRQPDTFTSVNIYRARNGEEVGRARG